MTFQVFATEKSFYKIRKELHDYGFKMKGFNYDPDWTFFVEYHDSFANMEFAAKTVFIKICERHGVTYEQKN
jgi:hypothetical protein